MSDSSVTDKLRQLEGNRLRLFWTRRGVPYLHRCNSDPPCRIMYFGKGGFYRIFLKDPDDQWKRIDRKTPGGVKAFLYDVFHEGHLPDTNQRNTP